MSFGLGRLGVGFGRLGAGSKRAPLLSAPSAPTLTLTTGATDNTPGFDVTNVLSGDVVRMQYDTHPDFSVPSAVTGTASSGTISIVTGALADGTWYFRARIERSGYTASDWSNTVSETIDATAPTITSANSTSVAENATLAWSIVTDENATVVIGGADAARFELASNPSSTTRTLRWASNGTKDFEAPNDANTDNVYVCTLTPTDAAGNVGSAQTFSATVTDVADVVNLLTQPKAFDHADWTKTFGSISANATTDPDGGSLADTWIEDVTAVRRLSQNVTKAASAVVYTLKVYAKAASGSRRLVVMHTNNAGTDGVYAVYDIAGAQVGVAATSFGGFSGGTASISSAGSGWYLCTLSGVTSDSDTTIQAQFQLDNDTGTAALRNSYTGDTVSGLHLYNAQLTTP